METVNKLEEKVDAKAARLEHNAREILKFIGSLDPQWEVRIEITRTDRGFTALQTLGAFVGHVLDAGEHTIIPAHPYFAPGYVTGGSSPVCPVCGETYTPAYGGQPLCSKFECAAKHYNLKTAKDVEKDAIESRAKRELQRREAMEKGLWMER